jgi:hypothetical protein
VEKIIETRSKVVAARMSCKSVWFAPLVALWIAACDDGSDEPGRSMFPSNVNVSGGLDAATPGGGMLLPPDAGSMLDAGLPLLDAGGASVPPDASSPNACNRDVMGALVDRYFLALKAHDPSSMPFAPSAKFTENGKPLPLGQGLWKTAGETKFKHSAFDTQTCNSVTEAVIVEGMGEIPFGVRLKYDAQQITEIETIVVREGAYFTPSNTAAIAASASEMWQQLVPVSQRGTRAQLEKIVDDYFVYFPTGACNFASQCVRFENGFSPGACSLGLSCSTSSPGTGAKPRLSVVDLEAGIAVGFVMFANAYTDFHMFRVRGGEVQGVHAILAGADSSGW